MPNFLSDLSLAVQSHEGFFPGSRSSRNRNPGNIRITPNIAKLYGAHEDHDGFAVFKDLTTGFRALMEDLYAKICGKSAHIDYSKNPSFLNLFQVYAPTDDGNSPSSYCLTVCNTLSKYNVHPLTPLSAVAELVHGNLSCIPEDPVPIQPLPPRAQARGRARLAKRKTA